MSEDEPTGIAIDDSAPVPEPAADDGLRIDGYDVVADVKVRLNPVLLEPTSPASSQQSLGRRGRTR